MFKGCTALENITIPEWVTFIGSSAFDNTNLKSITIPSNIEQIEEYSFYLCSRMKEVTIEGETIEKFGDYAFKSCGSIEKFNFNGKVKTVGEYCFDGCSLIEEFEFAKDIEEIGDFGFGYCRSLENIRLDKIESIGEFAFTNCISLKVVDLSNVNTVPTIESGIFSECDSLVKILVKSGMKSSYLADENWNTYADKIVES